jgi:hypothetical protein
MRKLPLPTGGNGVVKRQFTAPHHQMKSGCARQADAGHDRYRYGFFATIFPPSEM